MAWPETVRRSDLVITWFSGTGAGGQHRNRHPNCCRMVHTPTGTMATGQASKSREQNQRHAFLSLCKVLVPIMRKLSVRQRGTNEERIRTYHFPRGTVVDHRIPGKSFPLDRVLDGDLGPIHTAVLPQLKE